jgi:hypothetical protein
MLIRLGRGLANALMQVVAPFRTLMTEDGASLLTSEDGRLLCWD